MSWVKNSIWTLICLVLPAILVSLIIGKFSFSDTITINLNNQDIPIPLYVIHLPLIIGTWLSVYIFRFLMGYNKLADVFFLSASSTAFISLLVYGIRAIQTIKGGAAMMALAQPQTTDLAQKIIYAGNLTQYFMGAIAVAAVILIIISVYKLYKKRNKGVPAA